MQRPRAREGAASPELWVAALVTVATVLYWYHGRRDGLVDTASRLGLEIPEPLRWAAFLQCAAAALLLGLLPGLAAVLLLRRSLRDLGLGAGEWRLGLGIAVPTAAVVLAATFLARGDPAGLCGLYPLSSLAAAGGVGLLAWEAAYLVYYIAWEGLFRGVVQLGLGERWGFAPAAALQTALSALLHAGHPEAETLAACLAGPLLGWLAWRVRSIWPGVLIHAAAGLATDLSCGILAS